VRRLVSMLTREVTASPAPEIPARPGDAAPLARRTPMATLTSSILRRQAAG
jgi:hypothetical protein